MLKVFAPLPLLALVCTTAHAQNLSGVSLTGTIPVALANTRISAIFGDAAPAKVKVPLDTYKLRYKSRDEKGSSVILSGLLVLPRGGAPKGLVVFNHGTTVDRRASPSRFTGQPTGSETEVAALAFASGGYAVAMPDYLGLGDHNATHPYPLGVINSAAGIDMILPARSAANRVGVKLGTPLYISGYSEGGAVTMAATRTLESKLDPLYRVTASAPLSGPYDLSGVTRKSLLVPPRNQLELATRLYLMSYMVYYFHKSQGVKLTDYFKPMMANAIARCYDNNMSDENVIKNLTFTAVLMRSKNSLENVLNPRFYKAMQTLDMKDPLIRELIKNDCYNWTPRTKMLLVALKNDAVVSDKNTDKAIITMRARGVSSNLVRKYVIKEKDELNHISVIPSAIMVARRYFDGGFPSVKGSE